MGFPRGKKRPTPQRIRPRGWGGILRLSKYLNALGLSGLLAKALHAAEDAQTADEGETGPGGGGERGLQRTSC